jgi:tetratricopeptide (TPR) repeat protein
MGPIYDYKRFKWAFFFLSLTVSLGCKKMIDVKAPVTSINANNVYNSDATAISVVTSMYKNMTISDNFTGITSISLRAGLSSDELTLYNGVTHQSYIAYYKNALVSSSPTLNYGSECWSSFYNYIFVCNAALEGLNNSSKITPAIKQQLIGEAKFVRALIYFYLVNLYGDLPLATTTDWKINSLLPRSSKNLVYQQIVSDLIDARELLSNSYLDGTLLASSVDRVRPTKMAASALLARVYLYTGDYANAEIEATKIINNPTFSLNIALNNCFLKNSMEAIWQLMPTVVGWNTQDARTFIIPSSGPSDPTGNPNANPVYLSSTFLKSFESGDKRASLGTWINRTIYKVNSTTSDTVYYPFKYKSAKQNDPITEYLMVLRLSEQYLIRAEARAQLGKIDESKADLNSIRSRAGLGDVTTSDKNILISSILHERQVELFTEWGHRWLDLKRTGYVTSVMTSVCPQKGGVWNDYQQLYPILLQDIQKNPNLSQNAGY